VSVAHRGGLSYFTKLQGSSSTCFALQILLSHAQCKSLAKFGLLKKLRLLVFQEVYSKNSHYAYSNSFTPRVQMQREKKGIKENPPSEKY